MAKNNSNNAQQVKTKGYKLVCCLNCLHAHLHRYGNNPILAACQKKPQPDNERFPFQVEVACHLRKCDAWELDTEKKTVEVRKKVS